MSWKVDLTAMRKALDRFPQNREEVPVKHGQFEKEISFDFYAKLVPIGVRLAPLVKRIQKIESLTAETIVEELSEYEILEFRQGVDDLQNAVALVNFDRLLDQGTIDQVIRNASAALNKAIPKVDHYAMILERRTKDRSQPAQGAPPVIDTTEAKAVIDSLKKEKEEAAEAYAKMKQMELADDQITELTNCIGRHTKMSYWCLGLLLGAVLLAAKLVVWISADGDKLFICHGPTFRAITAETNSGAAFYYGVSKLVVASFAFGLVILIGRLYQTYCHNLVINEQRRIAFLAFKKMLASVPDPGPREKLVTAAANAIFEHGSSGFLPKGTNEFTPLIGPLMEAAKAPKRGG